MGVQKHRKPILAPDFQDSQSPSSLGGGASRLIVGGFDPGTGNTNGLLINLQRNENTTGYEPIVMDDTAGSGEKVSQLYKSDSMPASWDEANAKFVIDAGETPASYTLDGFVHFTGTANRVGAILPRVNGTDKREFRHNMLVGDDAALRIFSMPVKAVLTLEAGDEVDLAYAALGLSSTMNLKFYGATLTLTKL